MIDNHTISLPQLAPQLEGISIAHLTDLHVQRPRKRFRRLVDETKKLRADLVFLTGDYMSDPGDEPAAIEVLRAVVDQLNPNLGVFGVFGNHDSFAFRQMCDALPVRWLNNDATALDELPIDILGFENDRDTRPDAVALLRTMAGCVETNGSGHEVDKNAIPTNRRLRLLLSHYPTLLPTAADLGVDLMFSGHTHGGQMRLPNRFAPYTSCDLPSKLATGVLRHRDTLALVSRGIGETFLPIRMLCPPHIPVYTLQHGELPGEQTSHIQSVVHW